MVISQISLVLAVALSTYLTVLSHIPPNPNPSFSDFRAQPKDRYQKFVGLYNLMFRKLAIINFCAYHAFIVCLYPFSEPASETLTGFCPNYANLNTTLFTWTPKTTIYLVMIYASTSLRLLAFAQLGTSFTFRLARPPTLRTTGLYAYVQHPSYIANLLLVAFNILLFFQPVGVMGCWLSKDAVASAWWGYIAWPLAISGAVALNMRVTDEEKMLKEAFGEEWEVWHAKTKRFIPWVI